MQTLKNHKVVVLTVNYEYLDYIPWQKATQMLYRSGQPAEVVSYTEICLANGMYVPKVIRLVKTIRQFYGRKVRWTRENLFIRDGYKCLYCGQPFSKHELSIDHIVPEDRGGKISWENTATACKPCNNMKDNRTPSEAKMYLRHRAFSPTIMEFATRKIKLQGIEEVLREIGCYREDKD